MLIGSLVKGFIRPLFMVVILVSISACAPMPKKVADSDERLTVNQYFQMGHAQLKQGQVQDAAATVDRMELIYPLHAETSQLQLELIEGRYDAGQIDQTIASADRFITMFPGHKDVDYAHYLRGLADFARGVTALSQMSDNPDPTYAQHSLASFSQMLERFPRSQYAANAQHYANYLQSRLDVYAYRRRGEVPVQVAESAVQEEPANAPVVVEKSPTPVAVLEPEPVQEIRLVEPVVLIAPPVKVVAITAPAPMQQDERFYTIQVAAFSDFDDLKKQINKWGMVSDVSYFSREVKGKRVYAALYGRYSSATAAKAMMAELQARTGRSDLWLRQRFSSEAEVDSTASR